MRAFLLGLLLILSSAIYAHSNSEALAWTEQTLLNVLSVDYSQDTPPVVNNKGFTPNSWRAINSFLGDYLKIIREEKLSIHPTFIIKPTLVDSGITSGIHFWRVNEVVFLPEIKIRVAFSLVVIATSNSYIIQSMNMEKQES